MNDETLARTTVSLPGDGGMAARIRGHDWAASLGSIQGWPQSLTTVVNLMLTSPQLATLAVGPARVFLYNDEAARHYGKRHPGVLGRPLAEAFPHEFDKVAPFYDRVFAGESLHVSAQPLDPAQTGTPELFDAFLAPVRDRDGRVIAAWMTGFAVGDRRRAEERLRESEAQKAALLQLSDALRTISDPAEIRHVAMQVLGEQLGLTRVYYFSVEQDDDGWAHVIERGYQRDPSQLTFVGRYPLRDFGSWMFEGFERGEVVAVPDIETLPGLTEAQRASYRAVGVAAFINVPLLRDGAYAAGIGMHDTAPHAWTEAEIDVVREVAARTWTATERARAETALRANEERQAFLLQLSDALRPIADPVEIQGEAARLLGEHLAVDRAYYMEIDWTRMVLVVARDHRRADAPSLAGEYPLALFQSLIERMRDGRPLVVDDTEVSPLVGEEERAAFRAGAARSFVAIPLVKAGATVSCLIVGTVGPQAWGQERVALVEDVAERTWAAVERARAEERLRESEARLAEELDATRLLQRFSTALIPAQAPAATYRDLMDAMMALMQSQAGSIQTYDEASATLKLIAYRGYAAESAEYWAIIDASSTSVCGKALNANQRLIIPDVEANEELAGTRSLEEYRRCGLRAVQSTPLNDRAGRPLGMISTCWSEPHDPGEDDLRRFDVLARMTADLLERLRAEEAVRASEERLRTALSISTVGVTFWNESGRLLDMNDAFLRMTGLTREQALGKSWQELTPPEFRSRSAKFVDEINTTGEGTPYEKQLFRQDGSRWWGLFAARKLGDGFVEFVLEVSAHREAERAQRESEERLRQFGDASQDILWIRDADTLQWQYLTPAFEAIYGLSRAEALSGNNFRSWLELIVPEDRHHAIESTRRVRAGAHVAFDYRIRRPTDGEIRWLRNTDFPITDASGTVTLIGGIGHDATALREVELRLQSLMEGIPQLVWRAVDGGQWTWASPQWTAYTGRSTRESQDWGWLEALHPDDRTAAREAWSHAIERGEFEVECRIRSQAEGEYRWFQTRATPVRDGAGTIIEWLGTSTDIHDLRELQEHQKVLVGELQHRTRNLIGVVRAMADKTVRSSPDLPEFRTRFHDRLDALARIQALLSRLNEHDRVTFDELIRIELAAMDGSAERVTLEGPAGVRLRSSTVQTLAMAVHELATNAIKYGALGQKAGRLAITWSLEHAGPGGRPWLHIHWRESGVEMPAPGSAPQGTGHGRELIERALPYQLSAKTSYSLGPDGVHCAISIPVSPARSS